MKETTVRRMVDLMLNAAKNQLKFDISIAKEYGIGTTKKDIKDIVCDTEDYIRLAGLIEAHQIVKAYNFWQMMDTASRDAVPNKVVEFLEHCNEVE
jgi:hypothetical protein